MSTPSCNTFLYGFSNRKAYRNKVVFVTVITDLNTCHPTWYVQLMIRKTYSKAICWLDLTIGKKRRFHADVNRCYCPSEEVAKRAALDDLQPSQIRVFGLPIRPLFCRAVLVKVFSSLWFLIFLFLLFLVSIIHGLSKGWYIHFTRFCPIVFNEYPVYPKALLLKFQKNR